MLKEINVGVVLVKAQLFVTGHSKGCVLGTIPRWDGLRYINLDDTALKDIVALLLPQTDQGYPYGTPYGLHNVIGLTLDVLD